MFFSKPIHLVLVAIPVSSDCTVVPAAEMRVLVVFERVPACPVVFVVRGSVRRLADDLRTRLTATLSIHARSLRKPV